MSWQSIDGLREALGAQRLFLADKVPSYTRILEILEAELSIVAARVEPHWRGRSFDAWYERPLLLLAALRFDALGEGAGHPLHAALVADPPDAGSVTREAVLEALGAERVRVSRVLAERHIQTNETTRAVSWLWVAHLIGKADSDRPLAVVDLGTSAGLNLIADRLPNVWVDQDGRSLPVSPLPPIALRLGLDLRPLDALDPDNRQWLRACVWPGDTQRMERLEASLAAFQEAVQAGRGVQLRAMSLEAAPAHLATLKADLRILAVQTIVRDYLTEAVREVYQEGMRAWLKEAPPLSALWVELENRPDLHEPDRIAALTVHLRSAEGELRSIELARTHPHPRRLFVDTQAVEELGRAARGAHPGGDGGGRDVLQTN